MFDTMTITKVGGALCAALLVFLLGSWAAEELYDIENHSEDHVSGYRVAVPEAGAEEVVEEETVPFEEVYAAADAGAGERLWRQCSACHALEDGRNGVGPYLAGVVDRPVASAAGFNYSDALASLGGEWTPEAISGFIENPREYAPGTAMSYGGMGDIEDRANLIAFLATQ
ncbi:c-type cytochrome [Gymnodinialimonas ceratoperidinii]|uniref:Cytochrome c family protein n=1 Tax=Gymnodinialimonas ceratoperidinii TaxID=2856823 RepID=A0A8F6TWS0_9RHOB|nr:cytochrome c family protein [Gymnodinialimonas ceratoperidinii]QXT40377.1 cytochrome c family protein [Gymnodinialimonas ceratoperidinii]